jgi:uncharacterized protein YjiS (DUF1127 family)
MASLDSLSDELLADILSRVPQQQTLISLPRVCRWVSAANCAGVIQAMYLSSTQTSATLAQQLAKFPGRRRFREVLLEPTKVWERLEDGFAAAFWRPEGPTRCYGCASLSLSWYVHPLTEVCTPQAKAEV